MRAIGDRPIISFLLLTKTRAFGTFQFASMVQDVLACRVHPSSFDPSITNDGCQTLPIPLDRKEWDDSSLGP